MFDLAWAGTPRIEASAPPATPPTISFVQATMVVFKGVNVTNDLSWTSPDAGTASLNSAETLEDVTDLTAITGQARWRLDNVQVSDSGVKSASISDTAGSDVATFNLEVRALPTISFASGNLTITEGQSAEITINWGDEDAAPTAPITGIAVVSGGGQVDQISDETLTTGTARYVLTNAATGDSGVKTVRITDFHGNTAEASFTLTVNSASAGAPTVNITSAILWELPITSTITIDFEVTDAETSGVNPLQTFELYIDGVLRSIATEFSPTPASVTSPGPTAIQWSKAGYLLTDDGKTAEVRVTDGDGNVGIGTATIRINHVSLLKTLPNHVVPQPSTWTPDPV